MPATFLFFKEAGTLIVCPTFFSISVRGAVFHHGIGGLCLAFQQRLLLTDGRILKLGFLYGNGNRFAFNLYLI